MNTETQATITCPKCGGSGVCEKDFPTEGLDVAKLYTCPECDGEGQLLKVYPSLEARISPRLKKVERILFAHKIPVYRIVKNGEVKTIQIYAASFHYLPIIKEMIGPDYSVLLNTNDQYIEIK